MCKYCEKSNHFGEGSKSGKYRTYNSLCIKGDKLVIETSINRRTAADDYYESWGLDCDGEFSSSIHIFSIKYCPFCGKKINNNYNPRIFLYINDGLSIDEYISKHQTKLHEYFDYQRQINYDRSLDDYYLTLEVEKYLRKKLSENPRFISLSTEDWFFYSDNIRTITKATLNTYKSKLKSGKDIFITVDSNYKNKEELINLLKLFDYELIVITFEDISYSDDKIVIQNI